MRNVKSFGDGSYTIGMLPPVGQGLLGLPDRAQPLQIGTSEAAQ